MAKYARDVAMLFEAAYPTLTFSGAGNKLILKRDLRVVYVLVDGMQCSRL